MEKIGEIRRAYFEQYRSIREIVRSSLQGRAKGLTNDGPLLLAGRTIPGSGACVSTRSNGGASAQFHQNDLTVLSETASIDAISDDGLPSRGIPERSIKLDLRDLKAPRCIEVLSRYDPARSKPDKT